MGKPDERRRADELVEPLFAGLAGAEEPNRPAESAPAPPTGASDPWTHPRTALPAAPPEDGAEREPSLAPLVLKALLLLIVLVAISAFVYFAFGV